MSGAVHCVGAGVSGTGVGGAEVGGADVGGALVGGDGVGGDCVGGAGVGGDGVSGAGVGGDDVGGANVGGDGVGGDGVGGASVGGDTVGTAVGGTSVDGAGVGGTLVGGGAQTKVPEKPVPVTEWSVVNLRKSGPAKVSVGLLAEPLSVLTRSYVSWDVSEYMLSGSQQDSVANLDHVMVTSVSHSIFQQSTS